VKKKLTPVGGEKGESSPLRKGKKCEKKVE